jgi:hypothetical protein
VLSGASDREERFFDGCTWHGNFRTGPWRQDRSGAGLVDFDEAIVELQKTSFRVSQAVLEDLDSSLVAGKVA